MSERIEQKEWYNEQPNMNWQLIRTTRIIDDNNVIVDGYNEFIDTRESNTLWEKKKNWW